jgi:type II secretory pathway component PulM
VLGQKIIKFGVKFADQDAVGKNTMPYWYQFVIKQPARRYFYQATRIHLHSGKLFMILQLLKWLQKVTQQRKHQIKAADVPRQEHVPDY